MDSALFSVRRPRETLGPISYNTGIPVPASALKRSSSISGVNQVGPYTASHGRSMSGSRASLAPSRPAQPIFQRSSSGSNLAELGMSTLKRSSSSQSVGILNGRKSLAPGSTGATQQQQQQQQLGANSMLPQQRRSSIYSRPSSMGPAGHQSFFQQATVPAGIPRDPRPLRDRNYQALLGQQLLDYLSHNGFEMEMKHSLTANTMKSPTQKDFNLIFQWLYRRIDPTYRPQRNIDQEIPPILKQLRYPYEKNITKSQIAAVGGQNWSTFLGLLHWMMQLAIMLDRYVQGKYDDACAEAGVDISGDRIIFDFLSHAYRDWLQVDDDGDDDDAEKVLAPHVDRMAANFEAANERYREELAVLEAENQSLREQMVELDRFNANITKLDTHFKILETDTRKFEQYNASVESKADKYDARVKFLTEELDKAEGELREAEQERSSLQESVDRQGISVQDIDRMASERDRLQKGLEITSTRLEEAKRRVRDKELQTSSRLEDLERAVEKYNSMAYRAGLIPLSGPNAKGVDYELTILVNNGPNFSSSVAGGNSTINTSQLNRDPNSDRLLADPSSGYQPQHVVNLDLRGVVKDHLVGLRKEVNERRGHALEADEKNRELLDHLKEALDEKRSEIETLEHRVRAAEEEFEKTKEVTNTQKVASDVQIEKMEKELAKMRANLSESVQLIEQREMNTNIEYEQLTVRANALREELHTEIERILNDVIKFKVHIQKNLEDFEGFVVDEVEHELDTPSPHPPPHTPTTTTTTTTAAAAAVDDEEEEEEEEEEENGGV